MELIPYEIGFHRDCHKIALHFQGAPENRLYRSKGFRSHLPKLGSELGYPLTIGQHEGVGRRRLWIMLPRAPLIEEHVNMWRPDCSFNNNFIPHIEIYSNGGK